MSEKKDLKKVAEFIQKKNMYDRLGKEIDGLKNELKDILDEYENDKIYVDDEDAGERVTISVVKKADITYDVNKVKEKLGTGFIKKDYLVRDAEGLKKVFKKAGSSPKEFLEIIEVVESVDKDMIDDGFEKGRLTLKKMKGMYTATISKQIRMTKKPLE